MSKSLLFLAIFLPMFPSYSTEGPDIRLGTPEYGGNGCPAGTASAVISPDGKDISFLFDQYVAEAGRGKRIDRKSCNMAVPVNVPAGYSISVMQIDYQGYNKLPQGATSTFKIEHFFAGTAGPMYQKLFNGPVDGQYELKNIWPQTTEQWSPCGQQNLILRANTSLTVQTNGAQETSISIVDRANPPAGCKLALKWKRC